MIRLRTPCAITHSWTYGWAWSQNTVLLCNIFGTKLYTLRPTVLIVFASAHHNIMLNALSTVATTLTWTCAIMVTRVIAYIITTDNIIVIIVHRFSPWRAHPARSRRTYDLKRRCHLSFSKYRVKPCSSVGPPYRQIERIVDRGYAPSGMTCMASESLSCLTVNCLPEIVRPVKTCSKTNTTFMTTYGHSDIGKPTIIPSQIARWLTCDDKNIPSSRLRGCPWSPASAAGRCRASAGSKFRFLFVERLKRINHHLVVSSEKSSVSETFEEKK